MGDKDAGTPRVFLARHGETEWSRIGRFTGTTELALTDNGVNQVVATAQIVIGPRKLIDPAKLAHIYISPRLRAQKTFDLFFENNGKDELRQQQKQKVTTTEALAEWDYGRYEGLLTGEIRERRRSQRLDRDAPWDIWRDGCEDGESPQDVSDRLDGLIREIKILQCDSMHGESPADILIIGHGHVLRAFTKRWLKYDMEFPLSMMIEPGGVGILSYQHHNIDEPAFLLGIGFPLSSAEI